MGATNNGAAVVMDDAAELDTDPSKTSAKLGALLARLDRTAEEVRAFLRDADPDELSALDALMGDELVKRLDFIALFLGDQIELLRLE